MRQLAALEAVSDVIVSAETVDSVHFSRLNERYRPALRLGRLILANLTLRDAHGTSSASSFMVNMNDLFQRFVTERLRRALSGRLSVTTEPTVRLGIGQQVTMKPDLEFRDSIHRRCLSAISSTNSQATSGDEAATIISSSPIRLLWTCQWGYSSVAVAHKVQVSERL